MNSAQFLSHFERISEAPDAVQGLRQFVLELVVRGKLAKPSKTDEPVSELVQHLETAHSKAVKNGMIRRKPHISPTPPDNTPLIVPPYWAWLPLRVIAGVGGGGTPSKNRSEYWDGKINWFTPKDIKADEISQSELRLAPAALAETNLQLYPSGSLFIVARSGILKRMLPVAINRVEGTANQDMKVLRPYLSGMERYLQIMFRGMTEYILSELVKTGTTVQSLKYEEFESQAFPIPPLAEQHRIVAKVDELMALCDRLEAAQREREVRRDRLNRASLHRLNNGAHADAFRAHARFHLSHLPRLTTRPEHIRDLRQTILNLAVRGKLVPQDPHDEPASKAFDRIQAHKSQLMADGEIKKDKELWEGRANKPPYELPTNWRWTQIQDLFEVSRGGSPRPAGDPRFFGGPIPWITVREITKDASKYLTATESGLTEEGSTRSRFIDPGDLLLTNSGATLGVPKISRIRACMNDGVALLRLFHKEPLNDFAYLFLQSQTEAFRRVNQGMGQPNLNTPIIAGWYFPLPPLAEQHRIVAKVDELMKLCDQLESQLTTTQTESRRLLEAILHEALTPAETSEA